MAVTLETVIGLIFTAIGGGILCWTAANVVDALASRRWPQVRGTIIASKLQRSRDSEGGYSYRPDVSYRYAVKGKEFVARRTRFGDWLKLGWPGVADRVVRRYPVGAAILVHYNPQDPAEAVLEPGLNGLLFGGAAFGATFTLFGILAM